MSSPNMTKDKQLIKYVDQLKRESGVNRIPISQTAEALKNFCESNINKDPLVVGVTASGNPYKDKSKCSII